MVTYRIYKSNEVFINLCSVMVSLLKDVLTKDVCGCVNFILNSHVVLSMDWVSQICCTCTKYVWKKVYSLFQI